MLGVPSLVSQAAVRVTLQDVNDNQPQFSSETYSGVITTRADVGATILTVLATDPDQDINGEIVYSLQEQSNIFSINESSGVLILTRDIVEAQTFELVVVASDQGSPQLSSTITVSVRVVPPVNVEFSQEGAGFLLAEASAVQQSFGEW